MKIKGSDETVDLPVESDARRALRVHVTLLFLSEPVLEVRSCPEYCKLRVAHDIVHWRLCARLSPEPCKPDALSALYTVCVCVC